MKKNIKRIIASVGCAAIVSTAIVGCSSINKNITYENNTELTKGDEVKPENEKISYEVNMRDFNANTMSGKKFSQEDLKNYDITMVNLWTTWCGYCIEEMPALNELYGKLPKNVNMISICDDANEEHELAQEIIDKFDLKFETLIPDEKIKKNVSEYVTGYPTTLFIDKDGNVVGEAQIGVPTSNKKAIVVSYMNLINEALDKIIK